MSFYDAICITQNLTFIWITQWMIRLFKATSEDSWFVLWTMIIRPHNEIMGSTWFYLIHHDVQFMKTLCRICWLKDAASACVCAVWPKHSCHVSVARDGLVLWVEWQKDGTMVNDISKAFIHPSSCSFQHKYIKIKRYSLSNVFEKEMKWVFCLLSCQLNPQHLSVAVCMFFQ